jgi:S-adenosylmethionine:tRNA ribosyltransferase-isomerase
MKLSDFDYHLPKKLIAQYPSEHRTDSRLLVIERAKKKIVHQNFSDITNYLSAQDVLVLNNTKVIYARMIGRREKVNAKFGGGKQEIFLLENISDNVYRVLAKPAKQLTVGRKIFFNNGQFFATVLSDQGMRKIVKFSGNGNMHNFWCQFGQVPLPPYIKREPQDLDKKRYQTVYARVEGATAAPTAGLHFTKELLNTIRAKGIKVVYVTLHINYGTFAPVKSEQISRHEMHQEYFVLPRESAEIINVAQQKRKKIFAVGTTSVRVLETCAGKDVETEQMLTEKRGWTDLFIYPPYQFKIVNCLLTNFHFPKSTLLMLVSAFAGKELIWKAYQEAIREEYRFFSYGDVMLII